jgi:hypothetical protein
LLILLSQISGQFLMSATEIELELTSVHDSAAVEGGKTPRERILLLPEYYIGSVKKCTRNIWVANAIQWRDAWSLRTRPLQDLR